MANGVHVNDPAPIIERTATLLGWSGEADPEPLPVILNAEDRAEIARLANDEYRTPAQQVGWIVRQWMKNRERAPEAVRAALADTPSPRQATQQSAAPPEPPPGLMPLYHVGDGSAGSGCGKVGLLVARRLTGSVMPGDVFHCAKVGGACHHEKQEGEIYSGALTCCQCGGVMAPGTWNYGDDDRPERPSESKATQAKMVNPG